MASSFLFGMDRDSYLLYNNEFSEIALVFF